MKRLLKEMFKIWMSMRCKWLAKRPASRHRITIRDCLACTGYSSNWLEFLAFSQILQCENIYWKRLLDSTGLDQWPRDKCDVLSWYSCLFSLGTEWICLLTAVCDISCVNHFPCLADDKPTDKKLGKVAFFSNEKLILLGIKLCRV